MKTRASAFNANVKSFIKTNVINNPTSSPTAATRSSNDTWLARMAVEAAGVLGRSRVREELSCLITLAVLANPRTGLALVPLGRLARLIGCSEPVLDTLLQSLEDKRVMHRAESGAYLVISLRKWHTSKPSLSVAGANQAGFDVEQSTPPSTPPPSSALQEAERNSTATAPAEQRRPGAEQPSREAGDPGNDDVALDKFVGRLVGALEAPANETQAYRAFCRRYPLPVLEAALERVRRTPTERIRRSRGALFTFLVKTLAEEGSR